MDGVFRLKSKDLGIPKYKFFFGLKPFIRIILSLLLVYVEVEAELQTKKHWPAIRIRVDEIKTSWQANGKKFSKQYNEGQYIQIIVDKI